MTKTFTQDDVIRYIYNELSASELEEIQQAILCDSVLENMYKELNTLKKQLEKSMKKPSDKTIESIMSYSNSLNLHPNN